MIINTLAGGDHILVDDTSTEFTINGGEGKDIFQIGQVFNSPRDANAGVAPGDEFKTVRTTQGYLSRGISFAMEIYGGEGNDQFLVYHNKAELTVHGEDGDDKFLVRAFVVIDDSGDQEFTNIKTGDGIDEVAYAINAPVRIDGGAGYNALIVLLTEYDDNIVITETEIYGVGREISYTNIQRLEIDGLAGDDTFYILGAPADIEIILIGGLGSDTFIICGDVDKAIDVGEGDEVTFNSPHNTDTIKGKLIIIGGIMEGADRSLAVAVTLPTETNKYIPTGEVSSAEGNTLTDDSIDFNEVFSGKIVDYFVGILDESGQITQIRQIESWEGQTLTLDEPWDGLIASGTKYVILPSSPTLFVDESTQNDVVKVYNDKSTTSDEGTLTEDRLTGLNMGEESEETEKGIEYTEIEKLFIYLGQGSDTFDVQNTAPGTYTEIHGNDGNDTFNIHSTGQELVIYGGNGADTFNMYNTGAKLGLNGDAGNDTFNLYSYKAELIINGNDGDDYFDLRFNKDAQGNVIINGNSGNDSYNLEYSSEYSEYVILNGDEGDDIFSFADGVVLNGKINGGAGLDTLDYSRYTTARHVSILGWDDNGYYGIQEGTSDRGALAGGPLCTITEGFTGIKRVIGSLEAKEIDGDKLYSIQDESGKWILDGNSSTYQALAAMDSDGNPITLNFINYDFLYGSVKDDEFTIKGQEYGRLYGGPGNDIFIMFDGAILDGTIDGGGGNNTLDCRAYTTGIYVNLSEFTITDISNSIPIVNSIVGIHNVYGGLGDDLIIGDNADNILGSNGGEDTLVGGFGDNIYLFFDAFDIVYIIETELGKDILDFSNVTVDLRFQLADGLVTSGASVVHYDGRNIKAYIGGSGNDTFVFTAGFTLPSGTSIDGRQGKDTLDFSAYENARDITLTAVDENGFSGEQAAIPAGFAGIDRIIGSLAAENTLRGMDADSTYTFAKVLDGVTGKYVDFYTVTVNGITLVFENYQHLIGGSGDDTFRFANGGSFTGTIDGGEGANWLDYSEYYPIYENEDDNNGTDNGDNNGDDSGKNNGENNVDSNRDNNNGEGQVDPNKGVTVDLAANLIPGLIGTLERVKNIIGTPLNDTLLGDDAPNILIGGAGDDTLEGRGGYNTYIFGEGWGEDTVINSSGQGALDLSGINEDLTVILGDLATVGYGAGDSANLVTFEGISLIKTGSGNDEINITGDYSLDIDSGAGKDTYNFGNGAVYNGTINASDGDDTFNFGGDALVRGQLNGGLGDDTFNFADSAKVLGTIDGGAGTNLLSFNGYDSSLTINLATWQVTDHAQETVVNKFNNIQKLIGSGNIDGANDTIVGPNENTTFTITGENIGEISWNVNDPATGQTLNIVLKFSAIESLVGGSGDDTFKFIGAAEFRRHH